MKTLASFNNPMDAHLLRSRLEAADIEAFVRDENTSSYASIAIGGVRVDVADEDYERALAARAVKGE